MALVLNLGLLVGIANAAPPVVYGYLPYWQDMPGDVPWEHLTHLGVFAAEVDESGRLSNTSDWRSRGPVAVEEASLYGIQVELVLAIFDEGKQVAALGSAAARAELAEALEAEVVAVGAHGVNLDIEFMPADLRTPLVELVTDLKSRGLTVTLALPLVDWSDAYDYGQLSALSDGLFIMGYDAHWSGGDAGPLAPLYVSDRWGWITLEWAVDDYVDLGADLEKIWMGLPLYGRGWTVADASEVPASVTYGSTGSVLYATAVDEASRFGRQWDPDSVSPWYDAGGGEQVWYDDPVSLRAKMDWALQDRGLGGVGFWALGYDEGDAVLWNAVDAAVDAVDPGGDDGAGTGGGTGGGDGGTGSGTGGGTGAGTGSGVGGGGDAGGDTDVSDGDGVDGGDTTDEKSGGCSSLSMAGSISWWGGLLGLALRRARRGKD